MGNIETKNIFFDYPGKNIFRGMSYTAPSSSITYLAGENGIGKTTWIKLATGRLTPSMGSITFDGNTIEQIRDKISVVLDEPPVYDDLSGYENLIALSGIKKIDNECKLYLEEHYKLDKFLMKKKAKGFSLGQRHRLAVAVALLRNPQYLILDEPTIGLDPFSWELIKKQLQSMVDKGSTIIITGHDFEQIGEIAQTIVILHNGLTLVEEDINKLKTKSNRYLELLVDQPNFVMKEFNDAVIKNKDNQMFICIPVIGENDVHSILKKLNQNNISIYDMKVNNPTLKEIYKEILQKATLE